MKKLGALILTPLALALPSLACAWGNDCRVTEVRQATVNAAGATSLQVEAKAGKLRITGEEGLSEVEARGTACARNASALEKIQLRADRSGETVRVVVEMPDGWGEGGRLDLELRVPARLALEVEDGSGETEIDDVASLRLKDGSGAVEITDVKGDVSVHDGSGEIRIVEVGGSVRVQDGSGEIEIEGVKGSVVVDDGAGSIEIQDVVGDVTIESDGSGGIVVEGVGGDFTVKRDGSGGIDHSRIQGEVHIPGK